MAKGGVLGNGVKVAYSVTSPLVWLGIGQLGDVVIPGLSPDKIDTTVHSINRFKRNMPGMIAVDDMTLKILQDLDETSSADLEALRAYNLSGETIYWRVEIPVDRAQSKYRAFVFRGWVQKFTPTAPLMGKQETNVGIVFDNDDFTAEPAGDSQIT